MNRFYVADLTTPHPEIADTEAHHLRNVLRMKPGELIELFDGQGTSARAVIDTVKRDRVLTSIQDISKEERPDAARLTVAASPPKGDRLKWMIEKLTELGVGRYVPLLTERTVVTPRETRLERLQSTVIAACKQSGRQWLMELSEPQTIEENLTANSTEDVVIAHPGLSESALPSAGRPCLLLIGPEGGFVQDEIVAALSAGATGVSWPGTVLRTETAAVAISTLLLSCRG